MKKLIFLFGLLSVFSLMAQPQPILRNAMSTNIAGTPVLSRSDLSVTNVGSGTNWLFYGTSPRTVARLVDIALGAGTLWATLVSNVDGSVTIYTNTANVGTNIYGLSVTNYVLFTSNQLRTTISNLISGSTSSNIFDIGYNIAIRSNVLITNITGRVGIGTNIPMSPLHVVGNGPDTNLFIAGLGTGDYKFVVSTNGDVIVNLNAAPAALSLAGTGMSLRGADGAQVRFGYSSYGIAGVGAFAGRHARNTALAPAAVQAGDIILSLEGWGYGSTAYSVSPRVFIRGYSGTTWTDASQPAYMSFWTTDSGGIVPVERIRISTNGTVGIATNAPQEVFHVNGSGRFQTNVVTMWDGSHYGLSALTNYAGETFASTNAITGQVLSFSNSIHVDMTNFVNNAASNRVVVIAGANVTVATNSPAANVMSYTVASTAGGSGAPFATVVRTNNATITIDTNTTAVGTNSYGLSVSDPLNLTTMNVQDFNFTNVTGTFTNANNFGTNKPGVAGQFLTSDGGYLYWSTIDQSFGQSWFIWGSSNTLATNSSGVAYKAMQKSDVTLPATPNTNTYTTPTAGQYIGEVITAIPAGVTAILPGDINTISFIYLSENRTMVLQPEIYLRTNMIAPSWTALGELEIGVGPTFTVNNVFNPYTISVAITTNVPMSVTNYLVRKYKVISVSGGTPNALFVSQGQYPARVTFPIGSASFVMKSGDTMSGNLVLPSLIANTSIKVGGTIQVTNSSGSNWLGGTNFFGGVDPTNSAIVITNGGLQFRNTGIGASPYGTNMFYIDPTTGALLWNTDLGGNIGVSGHRPNIISVGTVSAGAGGVNSSGEVIVGGNLDFYISGKSRIYAPNIGGFRFTDDSAVKDRIYIEGLAQPLYPSAATNLFYISGMSTNDFIGGALDYTIYCRSNTTDSATLSGSINFSALNPGGVWVSSVTTNNAAFAGVSNLTVTWAMTPRVSFESTNIMLTVTPTTDLKPAAGEFFMYWQARLNGTNSVTAY